MVQIRKEIDDCAVNPPCVLVHRMHTCINAGVKTSCPQKALKAFKDETRSYCLSALLATLWRIARCAVLYTIDLLNSLVGGAKESYSVTMLSPC